LAKGIILFGIAIWFRVNVIPGAIFAIIFLHHLSSGSRKGLKNYLPKMFSKIFMLLSLPYFLVLTHNLYYGNSLIGYQTSVRSSMSFPFLDVDISCK
jgi:hypothetical protein